MEYVGGDELPFDDLDSKVMFSAFLAFAASSMPYELRPSPHAIVWQDGRRVMSTSSEPLAIL